ncbi:MAG: hypothetical protein KMY54_06275 [Erysipelothrix sp.]|nr:hypothetical protein [Erysipelothrix sp.]
MFFFENYTLINILSAMALAIGLFFINEATRRSKVLSIIFYILIPIVFTVFVWPQTGKSEAVSGNWFAWIKTYSALAGVIGFMMLRYFPRFQKNRFMLFFPALILGANIFEAVLRDFQVYRLQGVIQNGLYLQGGPWNIINGIAGIISILTITGWVGIKISNNKFKDMVWPDMQWFYVVAYCIWNMSYVYNCIPNRSFYAGVILLSLSLIAGLVTSKGVWLQHRAQILALFAMFSCTFPMYSTTEFFSITSTLQVLPLWILSILSIIANVGVLAFQVLMMKKTGRFSFGKPIYSDLEYTKKILESNQI